MSLQLISLKIYIILSKKNWDIKNDYSNMCKEKQKDLSI